MLTTLKIIDLDKPYFSQKEGSTGFQTVPSMEGSSLTHGSLKTLHCTHLLEAAFVLGAEHLLPHTALYLNLGEDYMSLTWLT